MVVSFDQQKLSWSWHLIGLQGQRLSWWMGTLPDHHHFGPHYLIPVYMQMWKWLLFPRPFTSSWGGGKQARWSGEYPNTSEGPWLQSFHILRSATLTNCITLWCHLPKMEILKLEEWLTISHSENKACTIECGGLMLALSYVPDSALQ